MNAVRRRVRVVTLVWLLCQVASLSAFVPGECCVSHAAEARAREKADACHETAAAPVSEPQPGDACPMHHGSKSHDCCAITNACDGPGTQLLSLFSFVSILDEPLVSSAVLESSPAFVSPAPPLLYRLAVPDAPPPKA
jgi:hypothetical protein